MRIAIVGYDRQGRAALAYWDKPENSLTICDKNPAVSVPEGVEARLGEHYLDNLDEFDLIVRTPGLHPRDIVAANDETILDKVTTVTNEFFKVCPSKNIIGVTGTKGKGTTSTLITKMLVANGKRVHLGGNIGIPPLDLLKDVRPDDFVVLELANYQLIDLKHSPHIAVCLMMAPEHQDWHKDMDEYIEAKQQLFRWQTPEDIAIYFAPNETSKTVASAGNGRKLPFFEALGSGAYVDDHVITIDGQAICKTGELKLLGEHNWQNACAAVTAVWQVMPEVEPLRQVLTSFTGLEHRLELVKEVKGVAFYNDSFASAPDATVAALEAIKGSKVMIIGGYDRNLPLEPLASALKKHADELRKVIFIGASAKRLADACQAASFANFESISTKSLPEIVRHAQSVAQAGDSVVLSPGFPSFDMFKNFEDRGQQFKAAVEAL